MSLSLILKSKCNSSTTMWSSSISNIGWFLHPMHSLSLFLAQSLMTLKDLDMALQSGNVMDVSHLPVIIIIITK